jgi:hypothetical protein
VSKGEQRREEKREEESKMKTDRQTETGRDRPERPRSEGSFKTGEKPASLFSIQVLPLAVNFSITVSSKAE